jgi:hypothetical protein
MAGARAWVVVAVASVLVAASCGKRAPTGTGGRGAGGPDVTGQRTEDEASPQRPETEAEADALARAIDRKICRKRGCCVSEIEEAGTDRKGRSLVVATIDAGYGGTSSCLVTPPTEPQPFGSGALDKEPSPIKPKPAATAEGETPDEGDGEAGSRDGDEGGGDEGVSEMDDCRPYEYHLIVHTRGKIREWQLLSEACNNGYGAAGVGEDAISVDAKEKTFTHSRSGGSAWRWGNDITVGLDPLRVVSAGTSSFWTLDEDGTSESADWNYDTLQGHESWSIPDCEGRRKEEEARNRDGGAGSDNFPSSKSYEAAIIPRVQLPAAFVQEGWRTIGLGDCGALVDGDEHGYAIYGGKGKAADAAMRVVASKDGGVLFVEVSDDHWTTTGKSWVKEDHIELWLAPPGPSGTQSMCGGPPTPDPSRQWGIRISDGQVFPAFGAPAPLAGVEVVRSGRTARARIPAGDWLKGDGASNTVTLVYSDSDDGLRQKRLIATSQIERGQEMSLGHLRDIDPQETTCVIAGKALRISRARLTLSPNAAIASP